MSYTEFSNLRKVAHQADSRNRDHALALVEAYATLGDIVYPVDYRLFLEVLGAEAPSGYRFLPYRAMGANTVKVQRA